MWLKGRLGLGVKAENIESRMIESLRSPLDFEVRMASKKLVCQAEEMPHIIIPALLRNYDNKTDRVREGVREVLSRIVATNSGMGSVIDEMCNPSNAVRKGLHAFLGDHIGFHAATYASLYEQTMLLVAMSQRKEVPADDIISLANQSKRTFLNGEVMKAVGDIGYCLDHMKHRYRTSEQYKEYVTDLLKMAPDLTKMGVYRSTIEEPLRKVMRASRYREYDETKEIVQLRTRESQLYAALGRLERSVRNSMSERPDPPNELAADDRELLSRMQALIERFTSLVLVGRHDEAVSVLLEHLSSPEANPSQLAWRRRLERKDPSALFTLFLVGLASVKLAAVVLPDAAEDLYQTELRSLVGVPSIHLVMWPEHFLSSLSPPDREEPVSAATDEGQA